MHARIATVRTRPDAADDVRRVWTELLDDYRVTGGFRGLLSLHDAEQDRAVTLTLWESAEAADAAAGELRPRAVAAFGDLLLEPPQIAPYDVLLDALGASS